MKNAKQTWTANTYARTNKCYVSVPNDDGSNSVIYEEITDATETISDRARLIAAAPEMLSALEIVLNNLTVMIPANPDLEALGRKACIDAIKAALVKAKGGAE